ncbi:MAG: hypothetical protein HFF34_09020 [Oscillospiraceae bacterium]|jgi:hypothetical protein|nr:hypothetical protein [Oscillospiraceae bacterium]MCI9394999.1 hypothetical protein [Oscillospiraceae bacterium]MCI9581497.1 hypothetical protein [Oscillospiraceae bacterium]
MTVTERYVGQVQRALFCTPLHRKKFIRDLEPLAEDFASGNPKAALADFRREFGTPEALAQQYMDTLDDEEVQKYRRRRKWFHRACLAAVAIIVIAMAIGLVAKYTRVFEPPVTSETTLLVIPGASTTEEGDAILDSILKERGYIN